MKKRMFLVSLLAIAMGYSCQNEFVGMEDSSNAVLTRSVGEELSVASAKEYFEANIHKLEIPGSYTPEQHSACDSEHCTHNHDCDDCELHNHDSDEALSHDHAPNKAHRAFESNHLPELKKSNIVLEWRKSRSWKEDSVSYVEVPMNMGGQMFALKKSKKAGEKMKHERTRVESMLVFRQVGKDAKPQCYVVTLVGHKSYLKKNSQKVKSMRHKPTDTNFSGYALYTTVQGKVLHALTYEDGKIVSKLTPVAKPADSTPEQYSAISIFDMGANASAYSMGWEYEQCDDCGCWHYLYEGCMGTICEECHYNLDDCICCFNCQKAECVCCPECYATSPEACACCRDCKHTPCICCRRCGMIGDGCICCSKCGESSTNHCSNCRQCPCACCTTCHSYPCECYMCKKCNRQPCICPKNN